MYSSVKFFEPTVIWTPELSGFFWISPPPALVVSLSLSPPQAATPIATMATASRANRIRKPVLMLIQGTSLSRQSPPSGVARILCARAGALQHQAPRRQESLHACERQLDHECQQRDDDRSCEDPLIAVDVAVDDEVAERQLSDQWPDRRRGDDVDRRRPHPGHDRRHGERQLHLAYDLAHGHPHAPGGLDRAGVDLPNRDEGVGEDRRDAQDHEGESEGEQPEAEEGGHEGDQGQLGDRPARVADRHRDELALSAVAEDEASGKGKDERGSERQAADPQLIERKLPDLCGTTDEVTSADRRLALVEDEVDRARERVEHGRERQRQVESVFDQTGLTLRQGEISRCPATKSASKAIAIRIAIPPAMMMPVLKLKSE